MTSDRAAATGGRLMRPWAVISLVVLLAACGDRLKWTEDVRLPDGRTVRLTRLQEFNGPPGEPFGPASMSYRRFEFINSDTGQKVRWEDDRDLAPVALSINDGVPELLTMLVFGGSFYRYNCPSPPYVAFQYLSDEWVSVPLTKLVQKVVRSNVTGTNYSMTRHDIEASHHHFSTQQVNDHLPDKYAGKVIDLTSLNQQTLDNTRNCDPPFNYMTRDEEPGE